MGRRLNVNAWSNHILCWEKHDTQKTTITLDSIECEVVLQCKWPDRHALMLDLLGMYTAFIGKNPDPLQFDPTPWPYLISPVIPQGYYSLIDGAITMAHPPNCYSVAIAPLPGLALSTVGSNNNLAGQDTLQYIPPGHSNYQPTYGIAELTCKFSTNQENILYSDEIEWNTQILKMPYTGFAWQNKDANGNSKYDEIRQEEAPGLFLHGGTVHRTLYRHPQTIARDSFDYIKSIGDLVGSTNDVAWISDNLSLTFPTETLLMLPAKVSRTLCIDGSPGWNISLKFQYNQNTWNKFLRRETNQWENMYDRGQATIHKPFPPKDLSKYLF